MQYLKKRCREEFDTKEQYYRYKIKSIEDKQEQIIEWINEQTEDVKHLWSNLIDLQKQMLK